MNLRTFPGTRDLYGVVRTLRKLYPPQHEPSPAIEQALAAIAFLETRRAQAAARIGAAAAAKAASALVSVA